MGNVHEFSRPPLASSSRVNGSNQQPGSSARQTVLDGHSSMANGLPDNVNRWISDESPINGSGEEEDWDSEGEDRIEVGEGKVIVHRQST